jgi:hypothetical protein
MKSTLLLVAALAATIGSAAAQGSRTAGANTSSSAANSNPTTASPNYKPAATRPGTGASAKPTTKKTPGTVVSSGGQGHNSTPDPKGKILVAPSATTSGKGSSKK